MAVSVQPPGQADKAGRDVLAVGPQRVRMLAQVRGDLPQRSLPRRPGALHDTGSAITVQAGNSREQIGNDCHPVSGQPGGACHELSGRRIVVRRAPAAGPRRPRRPCGPAGLRGHLDQVTRGAVQDVAQRGEGVHGQPLRRLGDQPENLLAGQVDAAFAQQWHQVRGVVHAPSRPS